MPSPAGGHFVSRRQQRWAFAKGEPFAKRWGDNTNFKHLPERVKKHKEGNGEGELGQLIRGRAPTGGSHKLEMNERDFDKGVGAHGTDRDKIPDEDFAGPHRSFPITSPGDVSDALHLVGHAANPGAVRKRIMAIAKRKGFKVPNSSHEAEVPVTFGRSRFTESFGYQP